MSEFLFPLIVLLIIGIIVLLAYQAGFAAGVERSRPTHFH